jgi:hypothetical protein
MLSFLMIKRLNVDMLHVRSSRWDRPRTRSRPPLIHRSVIGENDRLIGVP